MRSQKIFEKACELMPGGVNSPVRAYRAVGMTPPFIFRAKGAYIYDVEGHQYVDYVGSWGPMILGHAKDEVVKAVTAAAIKGTSFGAPTNGEVELAELIRTAVPSMEMMRMVNSGTEAVMSAIRAARGYTGRDYIVKFEGCYHGHSDGLLVKAGSGLLTENVPDSAGVPKAFTDTTLIARYNDLDSVKALVSDKTCAIILEALQGEGGITPATDEFMKGLRQICDEEGILLICDEIQCGMGRTGSMFAWQGYGVKPDIMTMAKAIGNGVPVGAFAMTKEVAEYSLEPGDHGTTYGGNPLACAAVAKTLELFEKYDLTAHVREIGAYLTEKLDELVAANDAVLERRGIGLIQGIKVKKPVGEISSEALKEGLLIISAKGNVLRLVPPLVIEKEHVDEMLEILKKVL